MYVDRRTGQDLIDAFWARVDKSGECWIWLGAQTEHGYGHLVVRGKHWKAHRYAYVITYGEPKERDLDHVCRTRLCVRPDHLEDVPHRVNVQRAYSHCDRGHELVGANVARDGSRRRCRLCRNAGARRRRGGEVAQAA
jgi:HNH endonuclease